MIYQTNGLHYLTSVPVFIPQLKSISQITELVKQGKFHQINFNRDRMNTITQVNSNYINYERLTPSLIS